MNNLRTVISRILDITGYRGETEIKEGLIDLCRQQATYNLLNSLSKEKKAALTKELAENYSLAKSQKMISSLFTKEKLEQTFKKASEEIVKNYIKAIWPVLSIEQRKEILAYLNS